MKALEEKILKEGKIYKGNVVNVGSFLNQRIDIDFSFEMAKEIFCKFKDCGINKILTIEASGIAMATTAAMLFRVPVVFAKKGDASNLSNDVYSTEIRSYTHKNTYMARVSKDYLGADDRILIIDDFLAVGEALNGLIRLTEQAGATLCGCAIAVEKGFQGGGDHLRAKGIDVLSLAIIDSMDDKGNVVFRKQ